MEASDYVNIPLDSPSSWEWALNVKGRTHLMGKSLRSINDVCTSDLPFGAEKMTQVAHACLKRSLKEKSSSKKVLNYLAFKGLSLIACPVNILLLISTIALQALTLPAYKTAFHKRLRTYVAYSALYTVDSVRKLPFVFEIEALVRKIIHHAAQQTVKIKPSSPSEKKRDGEVDLLCPRSSFYFKEDPFNTLRLNFDGTEK